MNIERLNININGVPTPSFTGNDVLFNEVARRVGSPLPENYIQFIRAADGGHPEFGCFYPQDGVEDNVFDVDWFYSFSNPHIENINAALDGWGNILGKNNLPIGRDGGSNQFYITLNDKPPAVWIYLHDERKGVRIKLAENFEQFIAGLTSNPDLI